MIITTSSVHLTLAPTTESTQEAIGMLTESLRVYNQRGLGGERPYNLFHFRLLLDEGLLNALEHGCRHARGGAVEVCARYSPTLAEVSIEDPGNGFAFREHLEKQDGRFEKLMSQGVRRAKGWGLVVMRSLAQGLFWNQLGNRVTFVLKRPD